MATNRTPEDIGKQLLAALTHAEISELLDALLAALSPEQWEDAMSQLSPNTQSTVGKLLESSRPNTASAEQKLPVSSAKLSQIWSGLWQEWFDLVAIASEEDGRYITQEASWETPYFDDVAFAEDLDNVAEKMRSHLPAAFEHGLAPETGFAPELPEALADIKAGIPDWIEIMDGISLGEQVTYCLLSWEWLMMQDQGQNAFQFAERVREIELSWASMSLDNNELIGFLCELPQLAQTSIVEGITQQKETPVWKSVLGQPYAAWYLYYMDKANESAPEQYLNNLRQTIPQKWNNGLPVVEDLLSDEDYTEAMAVIEEMMTSLLKFHRGVQSWTPETSLLVTFVGSYHHSQGFFDQEKTLLDYWQIIAKASGKPKQVNVLELQKRALDDCFDWSKMFDAFSSLSIVAKTRRSLFQSWQEYVAKRATPRKLGYGACPDTGWIHWLIDSIADQKKGAPWFHKKIAKWLKGLGTNRRALGEEFGLLRLLTHDLQIIQMPKQQSHAVFNRVVIRRAELSAPDDASRQAYLQQFAPAELWVQVMDYWQTNLHTFVPDPSSAQASDYTQQVQWMAALQEINITSYEKLLALWQIEHHRRSNLWKAMKHQSLDIK